jgi:hypothetical protein
VPYCFDTSAFIEFWHRRFPIDLFPDLWERFEALAGDDIIAPREVLFEIEKRDDELHKWVKDRQQMFTELDGPIQQATTEILRDFPMLVKATATRTDADPFVIALAEGRSVTVVTMEGAGSNKRPTIPFVCNARDVRWLNCMDYVREQGWSFRLN